MNQRSLFGVLSTFPHLRPRLRDVCTATKLTHLDATGRASMVDIASKQPTIRSARAGATVHVGEKIYSLLEASLTGGASSPHSSKGDVFSVARIAGISAAKQTSSLIPLCHSVDLAHVGVQLWLEEDQKSVQVEATATTTPARTGVEMEALTAASVAALTVYDMCKAAGKGITIGEVKLLEKRGGRSGIWRREEKLE